MRCFINALSAVMSTAALIFVFWSIGSESWYQKVNRPTFPVASEAECPRNNSLQFRNEATISFDELYRLSDNTLVGSSGALVYIIARGSVVSCGFHVIWPDKSGYNALIGDLVFRLDRRGKIIRHPERPTIDL